MKPELFDADLDGDESYRFIRDLAPDIRTLLEQEWEQFESLADPDFRNRLAQDFESRAWEMRIGALLQNIHGNISSKKNGPDLLDAGDPNVWIECVAPTEGTGETAVPPISTGPVASWVEEDLVKLRYSSAINDKLRGQIERDRNSGVIGESDAVVIAVSAAKIRQANFDPSPERWPGEPPWMFTLLYGFGGQHWRSSSGRTETFYPRDPTTPKPRRHPVFRAYFAHSDYKHLSAVLFTRRDTQNRPELRGEPAGSDLALFHNPLAAVPLPQGWLSQGVEFWVDEPTPDGRRLIRRTDWRTQAPLPAPG